MDVLGLMDGDAPLSVHDIIARLEARGKNLAYTTIMTILVRLHGKGLLSRKKQGRQYLYTVEKKADKVRTGIWSNVYQALFQNDRLKPILALIDETDNLSSKELAELKKFVDHKLKTLRRPT